MDFRKLIKEFENCPCGQKHECAIGDIRIGSGITADTGEILKENNFPKKILLVADKITLKAADALRSVKAIYSVASRQSDRSISGRILDALPGITAERTELEFTMSKDFGERLARIDEHAALILAGIRRGEDAAFVTIGDPMTYSTCSYLLRALRHMEPELEYEIIPGVNSWSALAAATSGEAR